MKKIRISSDALSDLNEGFLFYEQQDPGVGDYFTACLLADIEELRITGGVHRIVHCHFYRSLSRVFPYGVFYTCEEETTPSMQSSTCGAIRSLFDATLKN